MPAEVSYYYSVNCGDIDPSTLSAGDVFGSYNSVTDQFYGEDPETGRMWGVVDKAAPNSSYPGWLTGEKTWPCENDGATDESPRTKSFRYARNQTVTDVGVVYQFELEAGQEYALELGFYVPSSWTNASYPRTMKLVLNDTEVVNNNFTASNNSDDPFIIRTTGTADDNGMLKVQIGHADNAVWGPVVSYIDIMDVGDASELQAAVDRIGEADYTSGDYSEVSWTQFEAALEHAQEILAQDTPAQSEIDKALEELLKAEAGLVSNEAYTALKDLTEQYLDMSQGLTPDDDWNTFVNALANARYALESTRFGTEDLNAFTQKLSDAADNLLTAVSIEVVKLPDITEYYVGDAFDPAGLEVEAVDNKGGRHVLSAEEYTLSGYELDSPGTAAITVSYEGLETFFDVTVLEQQTEASTLKSLEITEKGKTEYKLGEKFSTEGMEVTVYYTDGSSKIVTDYKTEGFDSETAGQKVITVSYTEDGITVSDIMEVTVVSDQEPEDPDDPDNPQDPDKPEDPADAEDPGSTGGENDGEKAVQTGDNSPILPLISLIVFSGGTAFAVIETKKKRHS